MDKGIQKCEDMKDIVEVKNAFLRYDSKDVVLNGLSLKVKKCEIYGLLGPSGCGKTTLLKCLLGQRFLDHGEINLDVKKRTDVGYMPQEVALFSEFSIKEIFTFYGMFFGLSAIEIFEKTRKLSKILDLPHEDSYIKNLSGGLQRRVSLAAAIIHEPILLILDEPTAGLDCLITQNMWQFFQSQKTEGKTIIITTHYLEEARKCNTVSFMRKGKLLCEGSPTELINNYNSTNLENVFFLLCQQQEMDEEVPEKCLTSKINIPFTKNEWFNKHRFSSQLMKNICWVKRNVMTMAFLIMLPILQSLLFALCFGKDPQGLRIGLMSDELPIGEKFSTCDSESFITLSTNDEFNCNVTKLFTCHYISELQKKVDVVIYDDYKSAKTDTAKNILWGIVHISSNFSSMIIERARNRIFTNDITLENGAIVAKLDMSNFIIANKLRRELINGLIDAVTQFLGQCGFTENVLRLPIRINELLYGNFDSITSPSLLPAFICPFCFYFTVMFTSGAIMMEKVVGILERNTIAGLTYLEIIAAHMVVQLFLMFLQTAIMLFIFYVCYSNPLVGNIIILVALLMAVEIVGITFAFLVTELFSHERWVAYTMIGTIISVFILGGIVWPLEGSSILIRSWVWGFPITSAVDSYISLAVKGLPSTNYNVYKGFIACAAWSGLFVILSFIIFWHKKNSFSLSKKLNFVRYYSTKTK